MLKPAGLANAIRAVEVDPKAGWFLEFVRREEEPRPGQLPLTVSSDPVLALLCHLMAHGSAHRQIQLWGDQHPLFLERRGTEVTAHTSWPAPQSGDVDQPLTPQSLGWERLAGVEWDDEIVLVTHPAEGDLPGLSVRVATAMRRMLGITTIVSIHFSDEEWRYTDGG